MNRFKFLCVFFLLLPAGCMQAIQLHGVERMDATPGLNYAMYLFSAGPGESLRAAFLKSPGDDVEVVAESSQITTASGTSDEALAFMKKGAGYQEVDIRRVTYNGKTIGYLLTQSVPALSKQKVSANIYQRGGKIYFSADEIMDSDN